MTTAAAPQPAPTAAPPFAPPPVRRGLALGVVAAALSCLALLGALVLLVNRLAWVHTEPLATPVFGINYSCDYAEYLLLEDPTRGLSAVPDDRPGRAAWCVATLASILHETGARHVRISVAWDEVEPREGEFDFELLDALLETAREGGARVLLTVGIKAQRHPEYYIPGWAMKGVALPRGATVSDDPLLRARALRMFEAVVRHAAPSPVIEAWGAENEPYVPSLRANQWRIGRDFVQEEIALIHAHDPLGRPIVVNHAQHHLRDTYPTERAWILEDADVLGISFYPFRNHEVLGIDFVVPIPELGPIHPNYASHRREAHAHGREYWITEQQAEPWVNDDMHLVSPTRPSPNLSPTKLHRSIDYARRTGADRVYLWGAEWWLFQQERYGDDTWLRTAREIITGEAPPARDESGVEHSR